MITGMRVRRKDLIFQVLTASSSANLLDKLHKDMPLGDIPRNKYLKNGHQTRLVGLHRLQQHVFPQEKARFQG